MCLHSGFGIIHLPKSMYQSSVSRTADMNTPRDKTASIEHTQYLWRKHFGYDLRPAQRFELLLEDYAGWSFPIMCLHSGFGIIHLPKSMYQSSVSYSIVVKYSNLSSAHGILSSS